MDNLRVFFLFIIEHNINIPLRYAVCKIVHIISPHSVFTQYNSLRIHRVKSQVAQFV